MLRPAVEADLPALLAIRDRAGPDALSDPALIDGALLRRLAAAGAAVVWDHEGIAGFAAVDGEMVHLLVDAERRGGGIGRALLAWACDALRGAGHAAAVVALSRESTAARHYRAAGWMAAHGEAVFQKPL
jgi:GNAT superfamily N-acetyltransferase